MLLLDLIDQLENTGTLYDRIVELEDQLRHITQDETPCQFMTQKTRCMFQSFYGVLLLNFASHNAYKDLGVAQISTHLYMGNASKTDAWIFRAGTQQIAQFDCD